MSLKPVINSKRSEEFLIFFKGMARSMSIATFVSVNLRTASGGVEFAFSECAY
jgi:hypothetical protein